MQRREFLAAAVAAPVVAALGNVSPEPRPVRVLADATAVKVMDQWGYTSRRLVLDGVGSDDHRMLVKKATVMSDGSLHVESYQPTGVVWGRVIEIKRDLAGEFEMAHRYVRHDEWSVGNYDGCGRLLGQIRCAGVGAHVLLGYSGIAAEDAQHLSMPFTLLLPELSCPFRIPRLAAMG